MRVLIRVVLTVLLAIPLCLALLVVFALESRRGGSPPPERHQPISSERPVLGPGQLET